MRGLTPIPFTKSSIPRGGQAGRTIPTHHLRAYRFGTAAMLLHLVVQGEPATRCSWKKTTAANHSSRNTTLSRFGNVAP